MTNTENKNDIVSIKCPNPECGLVLNSPYHTICPLCAEPFPVSMLHDEKRSSSTKKLISIIVLIVLVIALAALIIGFCI